MGAAPTLSSISIRGGAFNGEGPPFRTSWILGGEPQWGSAPGKRNGKREMENEKREMGNGKWEKGNGKTGNGKTGNGKRTCTNMLRGALQNGFWP